MTVVRNWRALSVVLALVVAAPLMSSCTPEPSLLVGIHSDVTYDVESSRISATLDAEDAVGSRVVRTTLRWNVVEAAQGVFDWSKPDYVVDQAQQRGMKVYFIVRDAPEWASGSADPKVVPSGTTQFNQFVNRFKTFTRKAVQRYGDRVKHWEVWSEPNEDHYWQPAGLNPKRDKARWIDMYVQLYKATVAYVKPVDSSVQLAVGALTGLTQSCCILGTDYLRALIARNVPFEHLAVNPHSSYNEPPWVCIAGRRNFCDIQKMRDILVANNRSNVQMWVAEFGWQVGAFTRSGTKARRLRVPGNQYRLALWPSSGQVVVEGRTLDYSSITRTDTYSDINLTAPMDTIPPNGTQLHSPQAEAAHASYVRAAYQMLKGTYRPAAGRPQQNYKYVKVAVYFVSFDKNVTNWGMYGLFRTPQPDWSNPGNWILAPKPGAQAFSDESP
jgi:hypothetical protein